MKKNFIKKILCFFFIIVSVTMVFAQQNDIINVNDDVYDFLKICETRGLCSKLAVSKPYTEKYILRKIDEIEKNLEEVEVFKNFYDLEIEVIEGYKNRFTHKEKFNFDTLSYLINMPNKVLPATMEISASLDTLLSGGLYTNSVLDSFGYELCGNFNIKGDLGKYLSYSVTAFLEMTQMPLEKKGKYYIGKWWMDENKTIYDSNKIYPKERSINIFRNNSVLPFSYSKNWDGSTFIFGQINDSGFYGWPQQYSCGFGNFADIHASFFENNVELGFSRVRREWIAMDEGSSLVLNKKARPFLAGDFRVTLFDSVSLCAIAGILEAPHQSYINNNAWYSFDNDGKVNEYVPDDSYFFQNGFSMAVLSLDFKYFYYDIGTVGVWPKRFELGYMHPMIDNAVYQNNIGDYDNMGLFTDVKLKYPGIGSVWFSFFLDEMPFIYEIFDKTRCMFALQVGTKANIPFIPFTTISFRYTKIEPYCYTHTAIRNQPYQSGYIAESYTNNGECIGYYLPPNSDEFNIRIDSRFIKNSSLSFCWQFIRHGADFGSAAVPGSNLYSELQFYGRDDLYKYFLRDGAYEWFNIFSISGSYDFHSFKIPVQLFGTLGYVNQWYTGITGEPSKTTEFHHINTSEYFDKKGVVLTLGIKLFNYY